MRTKNKFYIGSALVVLGIGEYFGGTTLMINNSVDAKNVQQYNLNEEQISDRIKYGMYGAVLGMVSLASLISGLCFCASWRGDKEEDERKKSGTENSLEGHITDTQKLEHECECRHEH